jgi:hypothetical protein
MCTAVQGEVLCRVIWGHAHIIVASYYRGTQSHNAVLLRSLHMAFALLRRCVLVRCLLSALALANQHH